MTRFSFVLTIALVCAFSGLTTVDCNRQDVLKAFLPLKSTGGKQQKKLLAGGTELFVSLQSELILSQEPYIQQTIDDEANVREQLVAAPNTDCAGYVHSGTDALVTLAGISFRNCVAKIDDEMFAGLYPSPDNNARQAYAKASILSSIRDVNILTEPETIQARIENKLNSPLIIDGLDSIANLSTDLRVTLQKCLSDARNLLRTSLETAAIQASAICLK